MASTFQSLLSELQNVKPKVTIPTKKKKADEGYLSALSSIAKENVQRNLGITGEKLTPERAFQKQKEQQGRLAQTPFGAGQIGFQKGILPVSMEKAFQKAFTPEALSYMEDSKAAKVGEVAGTLTGFAAPYAGIGKETVKGVSKIAPKLIPSLSKGISAAATKALPKASTAAIEKFGQRAAESLVMDIAIGLPQNIAYATGKQGLTGEGAIQDIAVNTALDILIGGALEVAPLILKSGKKVKGAEDFSALPKEEQAEAVQEILTKYAPTTRPLKKIDEVVTTTKTIETPKEVYDKIEKESLSNISSLLSGVPKADKAQAMNAVKAFKNNEIGFNELADNILIPIKNIPYAKKANADTLKGIKQYLKNGIKVTPDLKQIPDFKQFRIENAGKIKFSPNGLNVDRLYAELNDEYGNLFPADIANQVDQLYQILKVIGKSDDSVRLGNVATEAELSEAYLEPIFDEIDNLMSSSTYEKKITETIKTGKTLPIKKPSILQLSEQKAELGTVIPKTETEPQTGGLKDLGADTNKYLTAEQISKVKKNTFEKTGRLSDWQKRALDEAKFSYNPVSETQSLSEAAQRLVSDFDGEIKDLPNKASLDGADADTAMGILFDKLGKDELAGAISPETLSWAKMIQERGTSAGQYSQAFAKYTRTPEGVLLKGLQETASAEREIAKELPEKYNKINAEADELIKNVGKATSEAETEAVAKSEETLTELISRYTAESSSKLSKEAEALFGISESKTVNRAPLSVAFSDLTNELKRIVAKNVPKEKQTKAKKDAFYYLQTALENKENYSAVWENARKELFAKYADNESALKMIADYFDNGEIPLVSEKTISETLKTTFKDFSVDFRKIVKESAGNKEKLKTDIQNYIMYKAGVSAADAKNIADKIAEQYDEVMKTKTMSVLKSMFRETPSKAQKTTFEKVLDLVNMGAYTDDSLRAIVKEKNGIPVLNEKDAKGILEYMKKAEEYEVGSYDYGRWLYKAESIIADKLPKSNSEKFRGLLRISMILNPKTLLTINPVGNVLLQSAEDVKDIPGVAVDYLTSKVTGKRTTAFAPIAKAKASLSGLNQGVSEVKKDIKYGVETSPTRGQLELPRGRLYKSNVLNWLDMATRYALQFGDEPFYYAAKNRRLAELEKLGVTGENAETQAKLYAHDRVFQNDSALSKKAVQIRDAVPFGYLVMPFAQTPANILDKVIDYSPAALGKIVYQLGKTAKGAEFDQKLFVDRVARSMTGTGIMLLAYALAEKGILEGKLAESKDVKGTETYQGKQAFSLNVNGKRYSFDWAQPIGSLVAAAVQAQQGGANKEDILSTIEGATTSGIDTVFSQSFLSGIMNLMSGYSPAASIGQTLLGTTSQLTPTAGGQLARTVDPYVRETYDPSKIKKQLNVLASRTPGLSTLLPKKYDITGQPTMQSQGRGATQRALENFIFPYKKTEEVNDNTVNTLYDLYQKTGETDVLLNVVPKSFKYEGNTYYPDNKEYSEFQKTMGQYAYPKIKALIGSDGYKNMSEADKITALRKLNKEATDKAKAELLKARGIPYNVKKSSTNKAFADWLKQNQ